ncbi:MAG: hypothetical protein QOF48_233 [Verrucomicrobiota bacterium]|jgi:hypothetical protein
MVEMSTLHRAERRTRSSLLQSTRLVGRVAEARVVSARCEVEVICGSTAVGDRTI